MVYRKGMLSSSHAGRYHNGDAYLDSYLTKWVEAEFDIGQIYPTLQGCSMCAGACSAAKGGRAHMAVAHLVPFDANACSIVYHLQGPGRSKTSQFVNSLYLEAAITYPLDCHEDLHEKTDSGFIGLTGKALFGRPNDRAV